jgi:hypothetical protein
VTEFFHMASESQCTHEVGLCWGSWLDFVWLFVIYYYDAAWCQSLFLSPGGPCLCDAGLMSGFSAGFALCLALAACGLPFALRFSNPVRVLLI